MTRQGNEAGGEGVVPAGPAFGAIIFDLDGTLVDSRRGIEASCTAALAEEVPDAGAASIADVLGKPLDILIATICAGLDAERRAAVRAAFTSHYDREGWRLSVPYTGDGETLSALRQAGVRLFVATNKRLAPALRILSLSGLDALIEAVYSPDSQVPAFAGKPAMAGACLRTHGLQPATTLVVGDSEDDREMAAAHGLSFAAASWGYGGAARELAASGVANRDYSRKSTERPMYTVLASMRDLVTLVLAQSRVGRCP